MSKQAMNYILEKMRGDSLTPLGANKRFTEGRLLDEKFLESQDWKRVPDIYKYLGNIKVNELPFLKGQWRSESVTNSSHIDPIYSKCIPVGRFYLVLDFYWFKKTNFMEEYFTVDFMIIEKEKELFSFTLYYLVMNKDQASKFVFDKLGVKHVGWF